MSKEYNEGYEAYKNNIGLGDNPYKASDDGATYNKTWSDWNDGHQLAWQEDFIREHGQYNNQTTI